MLYFGYGSNMNHSQMSQRCPTAKFVGAYYLRGWQLAFGHHATIIPQRGHVVAGAMWEITIDDLVALDTYEGFPTYYRRRRWRQDTEHFFFYEMNGISGSPSNFYIDSIVEGYVNCGIDLRYLRDGVENWCLEELDNSAIITT
jgi:gamma-glutamylcyclotransferase (GGCT)/AIG2-like uncharacterized protein YtfP